MVYGGVRIGCYGPLKNTFGADGGKQGSRSVLGMVLAGVSAGGIATIVSNPLDLIKTRQQAMASATMADVGREVMREEGFLGLWKVRVLSIAVRPLHLCVCPLRITITSKHMFPNVCRVLLSTDRRPRTSTRMRTAPPETLTNATHYVTIIVIATGGCTGNQLRSGSRPGGNQGVGADSVAVRDVRYRETLSDAQHDG